MKIECEQCHSMMEDNDIYVLCIDCFDHKQTKEYDQGYAEGYNAGSYEADLSCESCGECCKGYGHCDRCYDSAVETAKDELLHSYGECMCKICGSEPKYFSSWPSGWAKVKHWWVCEDCINNIERRIIDE